eukprot:TRINITY_DN23283_c2_g1_i1.p1 TRINITY_DN23283_c2_g1~~TRINITY_DN23283_c2_g1_i1.p1  ORF type:complete len:187 (+),score=50.46 TRINITY_DN23283_c2_g1_i1:59-562(+)
MMRVSLLLVGAAAGVLGGYSCPSSAASMHASCEVTATVNGTCADAMAEVELRIYANGNGTWTDPHNGGNYSLTALDAAQLDGKRITGKPPHYEDHFTLKFAAAGNSCEITACSVSQSSSYLDYSTNYCNVRNLYCGGASGCKYIKYNFGYTESFGKCRQHEISDCIA